MLIISGWANAQVSWVGSPTFKLEVGDEKYQVIDETNVVTTALRSQLDTLYPPPEDGVYLVHRARSWGGNSWRRYGYYEISNGLIFKYTWRHEIEFSWPVAYCYDSIIITSDEQSFQGAGNGIFKYRVPSAEVYLRRSDDQDVIASLTPICSD